MPGFSRQIVTGAAPLRRPIVPHHADRQDFGLIEVRKLLAQIGKRQFDLRIRVEIPERRDRHRVGDIEMPTWRRELGAGGCQVGHVAEPVSLSESHDAGMGDQRRLAGDIDHDVGGGAKPVAYLLDIGLRNTASPPSATVAFGPALLMTRSVLIRIF